MNTINDDFNNTEDQNELDNSIEEIDLPIIDNNNEQISKTESVSQTEKIQPYHSNKVAQYGDLVLIYEGRDTYKFFFLEKAKVFQNGYGTFKHDSMHGKTYGTRIFSDTSGCRNKGSKKGVMGHVTMLYFITNIWDKCLKKMTQILFNNDINLILTFLNISSNSIIYESGTGSGCLSVNMAKCFTPFSGHLYTFEFNQERAKSLKETFKSLGMCSKVTVTHQDVIEKGFEIDPNDL